MKRVIALLLTLIMALALSACANPPDAKTGENPAAVSYERPQELAREEFETVFGEYEGLEITSMATLSRTDEAANVVIRITYTWDRGNGVYGFAYGKDESGNWELLQQGANVTADDLMKAD